MEDKLDKLFNLFNDFKNQQLFVLAIQQILTTYRESPSTLYQILKHTNKLIYSKAQEPRLRLEHRQISAAIIEKTYTIYCERVAEFLKNPDESEIPSNLFHFEPILTEQLFNYITSQGTKIQRQSEIRFNLDLNWNQIDFAYLIKDEILILGKDEKYVKQASLQIQNTQQMNEEQQRKLEEEALNRIGISANFNEANLVRLFECMLSEKDILMYQDENSQENQDQSSDDSMEDIKGKYRKGKNKQGKLEKEKLNPTNKFDKFFIINPFNVIFNRALYEFLNPKWEHRHASGLILKSILKSNGFEYLNFKMYIDAIQFENIQDPQLRTQSMGKQLRQALIGFIEDQDGNFKKAQKILTRGLVVIAMDRFADYISDQTHMLVREVACQISINLLSNLDFNFWKNKTNEVYDFLKLLYNFIVVSRQSQTYEVCQSALFLVKGIYSTTQMEKIPQDFSELLIQLAGDELVDEVLILLAEIWKMFIISSSIPLQSQYYFRVYEKIIQQINKQEDISYASKAILELLELIFNQIFHKIENVSEHFKNLILLKKYFFHKIKEVRIKFYQFLGSYIQMILQQVKELKFTDQQEAIKLLNLLSQYAIVVFQHAILESNQDLIQSLSIAFARILNLVFETECSQNLGHLEKTQIIFQKTLSIATTIRNYRQLVTSPMTEVIRGCFTSFSERNILYEEKNRETIFQLYDSIIQTQVPFNHMEFQLLRIIRAAFIYNSLFMLQNKQFIDLIERLNQGVQVTKNSWNLNTLIWMIIDVQFGNRTTMSSMDNKPITEINANDIQGEIFGQMDSDIRDNMVIFNGQIYGYLQNEHDLQNRKILESFLQTFNEFISQNEEGRRQMYSKIIQILKQLGGIDYDLNEIQLQKIQDGIVNLVESIIRFNRLSTDLQINLQTLLISKYVGNFNQKNGQQLGEILINRLKADKFDLFQCYAAKQLVKIFVILPAAIQKQFLNSLYLIRPINISKVNYVMIKNQQLKKKGYGRKRLFYELVKLDDYFQNIHGMMFNYLYSEIEIIKSDLYEPQSAVNVHKFILNIQKKFEISFERLANNIWIQKMVVKAYELSLIETVNPQFHLLISELAQYALKQLKILHLNQTGDPLESRFIDERLKTNISILWVDKSRPTQQSFIKLQESQFKCLTQLISCQFSYLYKCITMNIQDPSFVVSIKQTLLLIYGSIKTNCKFIYSLLIQSLSSNQQEYSMVSTLLILPVIKRLTSPLVSLEASRLLGLLVPMLSVAQHQNKLQAFLGNGCLQKKIQKGLDFQQGFIKMTQTEYVIHGGLKDITILRDYQMEGIRWLGFLVKYNLNAALCDDMGLGKTLQTLTVLANEVFKKRDQNLISLVVAPGTVVDHWFAEIKKYISQDVLRPVILSSGVIPDANSNIWLVTYSQLPKLSQFLSEREFFFMILDEAHLLKNSKSKSSKLIRGLRTRHKVILSGTPVQNHLLELWALFDLLFQNYLGDEEYFRKNFSKAFHTNLFTLTEDEFMFDEQQSQTLKQLHKKVLPFILRRTKQDVLPQLPPKIIQDYLCNLSEPLQSQLYQILDKNSFTTEFETKLSQSKGEVRNQVCDSILRLLMLLRKVLDHPVLIRDDLCIVKKSQVQKGSRKKVKVQIDNTNAEILVQQQATEVFSGVSDCNQYQHSGKMVALKDILQQLGFQAEENGGGSGGDTQQLQLLSDTNKVLIFSRFKSALHLIATSLLATQFPNLQYLILDGSVPVNQRYPLITKFNEDPSVQVLLLTTQVGGLGLNLSAANIVVMFDHDYNPVNDQQAIDRAHRIGQRKAVQVYRLIVRGTLEEKIMGIQKFKIAIAKAIVNSDNASLTKMEQTDLLSLLETNEPQQDKSQRESEGPYSKILGHFELSQLEQMDFDKEY